MKTNGRANAQTYRWGRRTDEKTGEQRTDAWEGDGWEDGRKDKYWYADDGRESEGTDGRTDGQTERQTEKWME